MRFEEIKSDSDIFAKSERIEASLRDGLDIETILDDETEQEAAERPERLERLRGRVEELFQGEKLAGLRDKIIESFNVPQFGPYHNEGMFMDSHLDGILSNINRLRNGEFPEELPEDIREAFQKIANERAVESERYAFLHDIAKADRLRIQYGGDEKTTEEPTWKEWQAGLPQDAKENPVALRAFCKNNKIVGFSYFQLRQARRGMMVHHGGAGRQYLKFLKRDVGITPAMFEAIAAHEVAYQFENANAHTYQKHLGEMNREGRDLALLASFLDTSSSLRADGKPDMRNFMALLDAKHNFELFEELADILYANPALDPQKIRRALAALADKKIVIQESQREESLAQLEKDTAR
jgi:hypothetical protein